MNSSSVKIEERNGIRFQVFPHIGKLDFCVHGFSTRVGGISPPPYDTLNLGFNTPDKDSNEIKNRQLFLHALKLQNQTYQMRIKLVHGNKVLNTEEIKNDTIPEADGLVTDRVGELLATTFADCVPIFLADPQKKALGLVHAGWRGSFARIAQKAVEKMQQDFHCRPGSIRAGIGSGIRQCCFETGREVADAFSDKFPDWKDLIIEASKYSKWKIDLLHLNKRILLSSGLQEKNIVVSDLCTSCRDDLFFSYRRDHQTGRMGAVLIRTG
ncbi:MAG: peptidoglycan editing factor PgeF [Vulcanimicrobiota bacterium]